ncbi:MAG: xanthine dehydrogenase family protein subunit M [Firmicutes bacterium]|nr:xanthine dehydrogenase family protein subunit M [Bacillota bacterium]
MKPPAFEYYRPQTVEETLALLQEVGDAKILAGGQSLIPMLNMRLAHPSALIDINSVRDLNEIQDEGTHLRVGALVRHHELEESPLIQRYAPIVAEAERHIGHTAIRTRGTIGGSLAHADPAAELPVLAVLENWDMEIASASGSRRLPAQEFFLGYLITAVGPDELLTHVLMPKADGVSHFREFSLRHGDFALVSAAASLAVDSERRIQRLRLALGGVAETPWRDTALEAEFIGAAAEAEVWRRIADRAADAIEPPADIHASSAYRRQLARTLLVRTLEDCARGAVRQIEKGSVDA